MSGDELFASRLREPNPEPGECPLCQAPGADAIHEDRGRVFRKCAKCLLIFADRSHWPTLLDETRRYSEHRNDVFDERYRDFLRRLSVPLTAVLPPGSAGLDYGCGPGPALAAMLTEQGFPTAAYDPIFAPDESLLGRSYDFITCTEAIEHFHHPSRDLLRLARLLRPGGVLAIMTTMLESDAAFPSWWYHRDVTHVAFYRRETMLWIGGLHGWTATFPHPNVVFFKGA